MKTKISRRQQADRTRRSQPTRAASASANRTLPRWGRLAALIALAAVVVAVHWPVLGARAFFLDDGEYLHENRLVRDPSWRSAWTFLSEVLKPSTVPGYYQPLTMISLMMDYRLGGRPDAPAMFRATSLALHALNTLLVALFLHRLLGTFWPAMLVALLFGVHPITVESIAWLAQRKTLLASLFGLLSLHGYLSFVRSGKRRWYGASAAAFAAGLASKPTVIALPVLMLLLDIWPLRRAGWPAVREKLVLFALAIGFAVITLVSQARSGAPVEPPTARTASAALLAVCHNVVFYPLKLLWPAGLCPYYDFPEPMDLSQPALRAGLIGTLALLGLLVVSWRRTRALVTGWAFFFVAVLPTLGLVGFTVVIAADRFAYFPMLGFLMVLTSLLARLWRSGLDRPAIRAATVLTIAGLAAGLAWRTRVQLGYWRDRLRLMEYVVAQAPRPAALRNQLASALADAGRLDEALGQFREALRRKPNHAGAHANLAVVLFRLGQVDQAVHHWRRALQIQPDLTEARYNLGVALLAQTKPEQAAEQFQLLLQMAPDHSRAHNRLGELLSQQGRLAEAASHYRRAVQIDPGFEAARCNLAAALAELGQPLQAADQLERVLEANPRDVQAHNMLGIILASRGRLEQAMAHYRQALQIAPGYAPAHVNLANALAASGRELEAIEHYRQAIRLDPGSLSARYNLAGLLAARGELDEAAEQYETMVAAKPGLLEARRALAEVRIAQHRFGDAADQLRELLGRRPDDAAALIRLAWIRAACPDERFRNDRDALELAQRACRLLGPRVPVALDVLAAAHARTGRFDLAVRVAQDALEAAAAMEQPELARQIEARLATYRAGHAYNQVPPPPASELLADTKRGR